MKRSEISYNKRIIFENLRVKNRDKLCNSFDNRNDSCYGDQTSENFGFMTENREKYEMQNLNIFLEEKIMPLSTTNRDNEKRVYEKIMEDQKYSKKIFFGMKRRRDKGHQFFGHD